MTHYTDVNMIIHPQGVIIVKYLKDGVFGQVERGYSDVLDIQDLFNKITETVGTPTVTFAAESRIDYQPWWSGRCRAIIKLLLN